MWLVGPHGSWENARRTVGGVGAAVLGAHGAWDRRSHAPYGPASKQSKHVILAAIRRKL